MRILVLSDSHGNISGVRDVLENQIYDYVFYLGDGFLDIKPFLIDKRVFAVSGNCDFISSEKKEMVLPFLNHNILITHGNEYGVRYSVESIKRHAYELGADIVCFGHTHRFYFEKEDGIYFLNPGSLGCGCGDSTNMCAMLILEGDSVNVEPIKL